MTVQELLDELLNLQKQGFDLASLDIRACKINGDNFIVYSTEIDDFELVLFNE